MPIVKLASNDILKQWYVEGRKNIYRKTDLRQTLALLAKHVVQNKCHVQKLENQNTVAPWIVGQWRAPFKPVTSYADRTEQLRQWAEEYRGKEIEIKYLLTADTIPTAKITGYQSDNNGGNND